MEALARRGPVLKAFAAEVFAKVDVLVTPTIRTNLPTLEETDIDHGPPGTETRFMAVSAINDPLPSPSQRAPPWPQPTCLTNETGRYRRRPLVDSRIPLS